ncbi:hypothetical protein Droror1_Dr00009458 [Drosera rotundifolia]
MAERSCFVVTQSGRGRWKLGKSFPRPGMAGSGLPASAGGGSRRLRVVVVAGRGGGDAQGEIEGEFCKGRLRRRRRREMGRGRSAATGCGARWRRTRWFGVDAGALGVGDEGKRKKERIKFEWLMGYVAITEWFNWLFLKKLSVALAHRRIGSTGSILQVFNRLTPGFNRSSQDQDDETVVSREKKDVEANWKLESSPAQTSCLLRTPSSSLLSSNPRDHHHQNPSHRAINLFIPISFAVIAINLIRHLLLSATFIQSQVPLLPSLAAFIIPLTLLLRRLPHHLTHHNRHLTLLTSHIIAALLSTVAASHLRRVQPRRAGTRAATTPPSPAARVVAMVVWVNWGDGRGFGFGAVVSCRGDGGG